jgi:hypothetical protein
LLSGVSAARLPWVETEGVFVKRIIIAAGCGLVLLVLATPASAAIETTTRGFVCCPHFDGQLENFGGYTFKGRTSPSLTGQYVYFQYKRPSWSEWRNFKAGLSGSSGAGFYVLDKDEPRDRINDRDRWKVFFSPGVRQGYWKIRALFPRQGDYARSQVVKKYWVWQSD